jgi:hypothetical protein
LKFIHYPLSYSLKYEGKDMRANKLNHLVWLTIMACGLLMSDPAEANAAQTWVACTPSSVATYSERIHVRCSESFSEISFFAYGTKKDPAGAARYMSMATSALISGRNVKILYDPEDQSGASIGCQTGDCRLLLALEMF